MSRRAFNSIFNDSEFSLKIKENHFCSNMNFISIFAAILSMTYEGGHFKRFMEKVSEK
jgi:hypothetical protein